MTAKLEALRTRLAELADLDSAGSLLEWDHQTMMPISGGPARAHSLATLRQVRHERFVAAETGRLLEAAGRELDGVASDSDEASIVRIVVRRWEKARRVPAELAAEIAHAGSEGHDAWVQARARSDFAAFVPYLERNIELARRYVDCFDWFDCAYDALLDDYDPGMRTAVAARLLRELREELLPLIKKVGERSERADDSCLHGHFRIEHQRQLVEQVLALMSFDHRAWRIDDTVHPFEISIGAGDTRITTRWDERFLPGGLYSAMHECGHGLYEAGIPAALKRTTLGHGESLSVHESQSRMWENMVGRSLEFCGVLAPRIAKLFRAELDAAALYRAVNRVAPSLIRVEADEATYGLHIVLRFELEQELIEGRLSVRELPEAWNARVKQYLGIAVPDDARGVLQDVHWASGTIGYFPTYALGNLIAGQLWERAHAELPDLDERIAVGELMPLREWLRERIHRHGAKFTSAELLERVVGEPVTVRPFVSYLKCKLSDVYGISL
ncbi:MAG: carboxypeptidase M32 [Solirubrobacterales bacterium]|nr:carboxypeptidase M32 [Solirubrobacterales bacterium]